MLDLTIFSGSNSVRPTRPLSALVALVGLVLFATSPPLRAADDGSPSANSERATTGPDRDVTFVKVREFDESIRRANRLLSAIAEASKGDIRRKREAYRADLEEWKKTGKIDGADFNLKFEEALMIGQSYGLDPVRMRKLFSLLKNQILRADLRTYGENYLEDEPSIFRGVTPYFDWLGRQQAELAEASASRQEQRVRLFKSTALIFFEALIEQDAELVLEKFSRLRVAIRNFQAADADALHAEMEEIYANQTYVTTVISGVPILGEVLDINALIRGEALDGEKIAGATAAVTMLFLLPGVGDLLQVAKRSPVAAKAMGEFSAAVKMVTDENLELMARVYNRSKEELLALVQRMDSVPEVVVVSTRLSSSRLAKQSDEVLGAFEKTEAGILAAKSWAEAIEAAKGKVDALKGALGAVSEQTLSTIRTLRAELQGLNASVSEYSEKLLGLQKKAKELEAAGQTPGPELLGKISTMSSELDILRGKIAEVDGLLTKAQAELVGTNDGLARAYSQVRQDNLGVKNLKNTTDPDLLREAAAYERELFGEVRSTRNSLGEEILVNTNDGLVDKIAFSSIRDGLTGAINSIQKTEDIVRNSLKRAEEFKRAESELERAILSGDTSAISEAQEVFKAAAGARTVAMEAVEGLSPADRAVREIDAAIKRAHQRSGTGPKNIQELRELGDLNVEVMNVTNKVPTGPEIGTDRDVTYQLVFGTQKIDIPHDFVEPHYNKALYEALNPRASPIDLKNIEDVQRANAFGHAMDHAVTSGRHAEAYVVRQGQLSDALGGNPRTLNMDDAMTLEPTFQHKGIHWLNAAEEAMKAGDVPLAMMRNGEAMRQISKQYKNMLIPRIQKAGLRPEDILSAKAVEAFRIFKLVDAEKINPAAAEEAIKSMGLTLQGSMELVAQGLTRVTHFSHMKLASGLVNRVRLGKSSQEAAEGTLSQIGISWAQAEKMASEFPKYQNYFVEGAN